MHPVDDYLAKIEFALVTRVHKIIGYFAFTLHDYCIAHICLDGLGEISEMLPPRHVVAVYFADYSGYNDK